MSKTFESTKSLDGGKETLSQRSGEDEQQCLNSNKASDLQSQEQMLKEQLSQSHKISYKRSTRPIKKRKGPLSKNLAEDEQQYLDSNKTSNHGSHLSQQNTPKTTHKRITKFQKSAKHICKQPLQRDVIQPSHQNQQTLKSKAQQEKEDCSILRSTSPSHKLPTGEGTDQVVDDEVSSLNLPSTPQASTPQQSTASIVHTCTANFNFGISPVRRPNPNKKEQTKPTHVRNLLRSLKDTAPPGKAAILEYCT